MSPASPQNEEYIADEEFAPDGHLRKLSLARALGPPFSEALAVWLELGRAYLAGAASMQRINQSFAQALVDEDLDLIARLLMEAEAVFRATEHGGHPAVTARAKAAELGDRAMWTVCSDLPL